MAKKSSRNKSRSAPRHPPAAPAGNAPPAQTAAAETRVPDSIANHLATGIDRHQAGDLAAAEEAYSRVLALAPDHPHALHLLGVIQHQKGDNLKAIAMIRRAIELNPSYGDYHSNLGAAYFAEGRLAEAGASFAKAAELNPLSAEAHSNLAAVRNAEGNVDEAIALFEQAHRASPTTPRYLKRLADALLAQNRYDEASVQFARFLALVPDDAEVHNNLAYAHERCDRMTEAETHYRRAAALAPGSPEIANNLATILRRLGRKLEAEEQFRRIIEIDPARWEDQAHRAGALTNQGKYEEAIALYHELVAMHPEDSRLRCDYAVALAFSGQMEESDAQFARAIELAPADPRIRNKRGLTFATIGRLEEAEDNFRQVLELDPTSAEAYNNLGSARLNQNDIAGAVAMFRKAIHHRPRYLDAHINLCVALLFANQFDEAYLIGKATLLLETCRPQHYSNPHKAFRAVCDFDSAEALGDPFDNLAQAKTADFSGAFMELMTVADTPAKIERLVGLHRKWGTDLTAQAAGRPLPPFKARPAREKLRVGVLSTDMRSHSVMKFLAPILSNYDRSRVEFYCYTPFDDSNDGVQQRARSMVDKFAIVGNASHREIAAAIRDDEVDILFELNGFTKDTRLRALAYRPAPVQIYWLGYPFTTGVAEMDYILVDPYFRSENDAWTVEKPLVMPESWICFSSFSSEPISPTLPLERNGAVTFGSLNNPYKFTRELIALWSRALMGVPGSRFLLVRPECASFTLCSNLAREFGKHGVGPDRLFFVNNHAHGLSHLSYYDEIDVSLDTYPVNGGTTTCDALWMGVPTVSLVGPGMHQRLGLSLLTNAGLGDLCTRSPDIYVETAIGLANDRVRLRDIRHSLRTNLQNSALCDGPRYVRALETLLFEVAQRHGLR